MRAAFVTADVLAAEPDGRAALEALDAAGVRPIILVPRPSPDGAKVDSAGFPQVACPPNDADCWSDTPKLLVAAANRASVTLSEAFLVSHDPDDLPRGADAGCRPVLVVGDGTITDVFSAREPEDKSAAAAPDLASAVRFMITEAEHDAELGAFPFGPRAPLDTRVVSTGLSTGDLTWVLGLVVVGGVAIALGIAYWLVELYQVMRFPAFVADLTLQFIPQVARGALFMAIGAGLALLAVRRVNRRRSADR